MTQPTVPPGAPGARPSVPGTKLNPPPARPEHITRERLLRALDGATTRPLTLVSAPTGFGKTTLLSAWARHNPHRTAWFTITEGDSDAVRLMAGLIAALRSAGATVADEVDRDLVAPGIAAADTVLLRLLDYLGEREPLILIIDDYHVLSGSAAHDLVGALIASLPDRLHVVIATRADPVLPLGRLRATGAMLEIRSDQLRFDPDEADAFLNGSLGLDLDPGSVETLQARTEGWPAGLYLAALSLRGRTDPARFVSEFAGSSRHVVDYLGAEVLGRLSPDDRSFLLRTSILAGLSGPICDAVSGTTGSTTRLRQLERANLFIVPLDESGTWFRFHRLFAELLRSELAAESPDLVPELHRRAATWHAEHGSVESAIEHALAAGDRAWAATLVVGSWNDFMRAGEFGTLERLIAAIGDHVGPIGGRLTLVEAIVAGFLGQGPDVIRRLVAKAEGSGWEDSTPAGWTGSALASVVVAAWVADDLELQKAAARDLIERYSEDPTLVITGRAGLGLALALDGEATSALEVLEHLGLPPGNPNLEMGVAAARSLAIDELGDPGGAEHIARESLARAEGWGLSRSRIGGSLEFALGGALVHQGRPREAIPALERALDSWGVRGTVPRAAVLVALAAAYGSVGQTARARETAREARTILDACPNAGAVPSRLEAVERHLRLGVERAIPAGDLPSEAEVRVLRLLATSMSSREIAGELYLSINTVKTHTKALYLKLGTSSREATVARARELGLL